MAAAFVQATNGASDAVAPTLVTNTFSSPVSNNNALLAAIYWDHAPTGAPTGLTDTGGNSTNWVIVGTPFTDANAQDCQHAYALNVVGGSSFAVTVTFGSNVDFRRIVIHEVSGLSSAAFDADSGGNQGTSTSASVGTITPSTNGSYIFGSVMDDGTGGSAITAFSGFTLPSNSITTVGGAEEACVYQVQTTATAVSTLFGIDPSDHWETRATIYKAAATSSGGSSVSLMDQPNIFFTEKITMVAY